MHLKKIFSVTILLLAVFPAIGVCFNVTAHVDKTQISMEDTVFLTIDVDGGKADLDLSMIKDFKVISRGSSSSYNYINGKSERKASYQYVLIPLSKGDLTIPGIKAVMKGETIVTGEIKIHVTEKIVNDDTVKELFASAGVAKSRLYVGEQTVFSLKFFTSKRLSGLGFEKSPEFNGFSVKPVEKEKNYTQTINGILYHVTQVDYILIPKTQGSVTIEPAVLVANVIVKTKRNNGFDSFFNDSFFSGDNSKPVRVFSNPVNIEVMPMPSYTGTGKFSGLVGQFDIQADADQTSLKAGESATITIKISGTGNIMDAGLPEMDIDDKAFKVYDDTPVESILMTDKGYQGSKVFKKAIVPVNPGKYVIPSISLTYFDVDQKGYRTVETKQIRLDVIPSGKIQVTLAPGDGKTDNAVVKKEVNIVNKDILDIKQGVDVLENYHQMTPGFFVVLLLIPCVLFAGVMVFAQAAKKQIPIEKQMEERARHHVKAAAKMDVGDDGFPGHLYSALVAFILAKGQKKGETVTLPEARYILEQAKVSQAQADEITALFETLESVRFGKNKIDTDSASSLLIRIKQVMKLFSITLVCLGLFSAVPRKVTANPSTPFVQGIKAYQQGQFKQAAAEFKAVTQLGIKNPYLYYDIANAFLKANDIGHAVLWYERAKMMIPNDPDLNFNLAYARTLVKDKKEDTVNYMDLIFFWDTLFPVKAIQYTAIFFSCVFFTWAGVRVVKQKKVFSGTGVFICTLFILLTAVVGVNYYKHAIQLNAVVVKEAVEVKSGMSETATTLFSLHAGTKVRVKAQQDGYLKILFSKDKVGWVKPGDALLI